MSDKQLKQLRNRINGEIRLYKSELELAPPHDFIESYILRAKISTLYDVKKMIKQVKDGDDD